MSEQPGQACAEVIERLWEYIDGELDEARRAEVSEHLELCQRCWPHYDVHRAFQSFLRRHGECRIPPELRRKVFEQLLAEEG